MDRWHRVFGITLPDEDALRTALTEAGASSLAIDHYLAEEDGIRAELNSWAAWVESRDDDLRSVRLMERLVQTEHLFVFGLTDESELGATVCRMLAAMTTGMYQIDGCGLFDADGTLLVAEE